MPRLLSLSVAVSLLGFGFGMRSEAPAPAASATTSEASSETVIEADLSGVLAELTQALRKFSAEKQQVPTSLDALVAAGYLQNLPQAPAGKVFAIDAKNVRVILK